MAINPSPLSRRRFALAFVAATLSGIKAAHALDQNALAAAELRLARAFSGAVLATRGETTIYERAFGQAEPGVALRTDHRFRIGSVSKTFTAGLVTRLVQEGRLSLDDPITRFVPGIANGDRIKIVDLLEHQSGLQDFNQSDWRSLLTNEPPMQREALLAMLRSKPARRESGQRFEYNNVGYVLLGLVIEHVTGAPYADAIQQHLLAPLSLSETGFADTDDMILDLAPGYGPNRRLDPIEYHYTAVAAAGGLYSTVADLSRWSALHDASTLGWRRGERFRRPAIWHTGNTNDYSALTVRFPDINATYVVLSNVGRRPPHRDIIRTLPELLFSGA